ncbi:MAG: biotin/lipoyl-containing protein [Candidatus Zixiibacteriota bacterium]
MINEFMLNDKSIETKTDIVGNGFAVTINGNIYQVIETTPGTFNVSSNGLSKNVSCVIKNNKIYIDIDSTLIELVIPSEDGISGAGGGGTTGVKDKIFAPMPGKIVQVLVAEGDEVKVKTPMVIVEAMKMEHQVNSLADGVVKKVNFKDGDQVDTETPIIEIEIAEE